MMLKSDSRVIFLISIVAVVCVCVMLFSKAVKSDEKGMKTSEVEAVNTQAEALNKEAGNDRKAKQKENLGMFDPNTVDSVTLTKYGLGPVQIHSLMSYRRHNGTFDKPLAVSKLYNWSDADVEKVLPYIKIGNKYKKTYHYREQYEEEREAEYERRQNSYSHYAYGHASKSYEHKVYDQSDASREDNRNIDTYERRYDPNNKFKSLTKVDINTADTTLLKRIPGVGSGIANAIVKLRSKLGGFYSVEQLVELKFISPELYEWFKVEPKGDLHLININKASFQTLNAHPYISYNQTRDLMNYRRLYGTIKDQNALLGTHIFTKEEVERLAPYLEY